MRILVLTLIMNFLSQGVFGAAEGGAKAGGSPVLVSLDSDVRTLMSQLYQANTRSEDPFSRTIDRFPLLLPSKQCRLRV